MDWNNVWQYTLGFRGMGVSFWPALANKETERSRVRRTYPCRIFSSYLKKKPWKQECSNRWLVWYLEPRRKYMEEKWSESFPRDHRWPAARPACFWPGRGQHVPRPLLGSGMPWRNALPSLSTLLFMGTTIIYRNHLSSETFKCHGWGITFKVFQLVLFA